jgi:hypothetical protein
MTHPLAKIRMRRRGALLLILAGLAAVAPVTGRQGMEARADDGGSGSGGGSGSDGGSDGGSGSGSDGGGGDGRGSDDGGGDDHGSSDGGDHGGGAQGGKGGSGSQGQSAGQRDGALAAKLKGRIAPISEVEAIAGKAVPGEIIDVRLYRNQDLYVYRVKIIQRTGSIYDVRIDAVTRRILSARER